LESRGSIVGAPDIDEEVEFGATMAAPNDDDYQVGADEALTRLMEGNARFLRGESRFTRASIEVLADLAKGQHPFAAILGCSDSRVPPELIFDAEFGDLFVIRVAGNVVSPEVWGSLQYAGTHLKTQLLMVLRRNSSARRSVRASSCCSRICFRDLTRSIRSFCRSKSLSARRVQRPLVHAPVSRDA
jgi:hypothetical protein